MDRAQRPGRADLLRLRVRLLLLLCVLLQLVLEVGLLQPTSVNAFSNSLPSVWSAVAIACTLSA